MLVTDAMYGTEGRPAWRGDPLVDSDDEKWSSCRRLVGSGPSRLQPSQSEHSLGSSSIQGENRDKGTKEQSTEAGTKPSNKRGKLLCADLSASDSI